MKKLFLFITVAVFAVSADFVNKPQKVELKNLVDDSAVFYADLDWKQFMSNELSKFVFSGVINLFKSYMTPMSVEGADDLEGKALTDMISYFMGDESIRAEAAYFAPDFESEDEVDYGNFIAVLSSSNKEDITKYFSNPLIKQMESNSENFGKESYKGVDIYICPPGSLFVSNDGQFCVAIGTSSLKKCKLAIDSINEGNSAVQSDFRKIISGYKYNALGIFINFETFFEAVNTFIREKFGPQISIVTSVIKNLLGDINHLAFYIDSQPASVASTTVISFNSENHGLFKIVEGVLDMNGSHVPSESTYYFAYRFSWTEMWDQLQQLADTFALMSGQKFNLNELIQQYIGEDTKESLINNLSSFMLAYGVKGAEDKSDLVFQLSAKDTNKIISFFKSVCEFLQTESGFEVEDITIEGKSGLSVSSGMFLALSIVADDKSIYFGTPDSLERSLKQRSNVKETGCCCCGDGVKSMKNGSIPDKIAGFNCAGEEYFKDVFDHVFEQLSSFGIADPDSTDFPEPLANFRKEWKSFVKAKHPSSFGYMSWEGNNCKIFSKVVTK
ncbi:MAG: hypothetical protein HY606_10525 [Planctomycetes bacterium]|nr:hypothetical protein [Planctomycetota bacterium]